MKDHAVYQISLKVLLRKGNEFLFLKSANGKYWDMPGGRIDNIESKIPLEDILAREMKEELGKNLKYKLGNPLFQYRKTYSSGKLPIFMTVYGAEYISGEIDISSEHSGYYWFKESETKFKKSEFGQEGEYLAFKKYFKSLQKHE
jgi:8-oxo-dGTP pyrophosphatase MutT (NUDIX family)